ncbi:MAG: hypothetical protein KKC19_00735 [Nanoarchaeota archaeon]|nr:hypothetical protein [Nanoarchaeota archaeon]
MIDLLILEDDFEIIKEIRNVVPEEYGVRFCTATSEFKDFLESDEKARLYFLDDNVPWEPNTKDRYETPSAQFDYNVAELLIFHPEAKVFYTGSFPDTSARRLIQEHSIKRIDKSEIGKVTREELGFD